MLQLWEQALAAPCKNPTSLKTQRCPVLWKDPLPLPICTRVASAASRPRAGRR